MPAEASAKAGFTLIELLVVIGIISILLAILFPAVTASLNKAHKGRAQNELAHLVSAMKTYYGDTGKMPVPAGDNGLADKTYGARQNEVLNILRGIDTTNNTTANAYLDVDPDAVQPDGTYLDPWGNPYVLAMDTDFNGATRFTALGSPPAPSGAITVTNQISGFVAAAFSYGPNPSDPMSLLTSWGSQ